MDISIDVPDGPDRIATLGHAERNLKILRETLGVQVTARDGSVRVWGEDEPVERARIALHELAQAGERGEPLSRQQVLELVTRTAYRDGAPAHPNGTVGWDGELEVYVAGKPVRAKTDNQRLYLESIRRNDLVFGIGPAGTGKTYLAVAAAVHLLKMGRVRKIMLVRPAVEAGERLGFLPGDLHEKVNPYLRPLFDALHDMMGFGDIRRFMDTDVVEIAPLAYMRGRTLNRAVVILDEAQNTTRGQMKMFLTRMGHGSKMIVTGDTTQIDLDDPAESGLIDAVRRLRRVRGAAAVAMTRADIVRHPLVERIVEAYGERDEGPHETLFLDDGQPEPAPDGD